MKSILIVIALFAAFAAPGYGKQTKNAGPDRRNFQPQRVAITDVAVLNVRSGDVRMHQTVIIRGELIEQVIDAPGFNPSDDDLVVDGTGRFLSPGLIDAHVHLFGEDDLRFYLAHGITTVINMSGTPADLDRRRRVREGRVLGPTVFTAGTTIDGNPPLNDLFVTAETPQQGREIVRSQIKAGYDFVKLYGTLAPDVFAAIAAECKRQNILLAGHVNRQVPFGKVAGAGQKLAAHAEDLMFARFNDVPSEADLDRFAAEVANSGMIVTANLALNASVIRQLNGLEQLLHEGDAKELSAAAYSQWIRSNNRNTDSDPQSRREEIGRIQPLIAKFVNALHRHGVPLVLGTDAAAYNVPGVSVLEELQETERAGLSRWETIKTATLNAGRLLRDIQNGPEVGVVEPGARADLLLLDSDPRADLDNFRSIRGIVLRGKWIDRRRLDAETAQAAARMRREHAEVEAIDALIDAGDINDAIARHAAVRSPEPLLAEWVLLTKARKAMAVPGRSAAIAHWNLTLYPRSFAANLLMADLLFRARNRADAKILARRALALQPGEARAQNILEQSRFSVLPSKLAPGKYQLALHNSGSAKDAELVITRNGDSWAGTIAEDGNAAPIRNVVAGGNRIWFRAGSGFAEKEVRLKIDSSHITGYWCSSFGRNGPVTGVALFE